MMMVLKGNSGFVTYGYSKLETTTDSTQTRYREHGHEFTIDPAVAYFSGRLGTQRMQTFDAVSALS